MLEYNKLIAAFVSVIAMRLLLRWTGIDVNALGVGTEFQAAVALGVDAAVAAVTGFLVWWVPNVRARLRDKWGELLARLGIPIAPRD